MPTFTEENWQNIKKNINELAIPRTASFRSLFCMPTSATHDETLIQNLKNFLSLVDSKEKDIDTKSMIMIGSLCYFHYQKGGLQTVVSGSNFAGCLAPLVKGTEPIQKSALVSFANFVRENENDIYKRKDDKLSWLFSGDSEQDIYSKVVEQLRVISNPGILSGLWNSVSFT